MCRQIDVAGAAAVLVPWVGSWCQADVAGAGDLVLAVLVLAVLVLTVLALTVLVLTVPSVESRRQIGAVGTATVPVRIVS